MGVLSWIVVGLIVGWFTNRLMEGGGFGFVGETTSGVAGAILSGVLTSYLLDFNSPLMQVHWVSIFVAALGALALVAILRRTVGSNSSP